MWKVVLCSLLAVAAASKLPDGFVKLYNPGTSAYYPAPHVHVHSALYKPTYGSYEEPRKEEVQPPIPYSFDFNGQTEDSATFYRKESGDDKGFKTGSYGYKDAFGVYRQVDYVADDNGFRAVIKTNEPGSYNADPADVKLTAEESPVKYEAPVKTYEQTQTQTQLRTSHSTSSGEKKTQGFVHLFSHPPQVYVKSSSIEPQKFYVGAPY